MWQKDWGLYGFGVYRSREDGGERITADKLVLEHTFDKWAAGMLPFNDKEFLITEDGNLVVRDKENGTVATVPREGKLLVQYGAGDLEVY